MGVQGIIQENEEYRKELEYFKNKSSRQMKEIERLNKENKLLQDMDKILRNENTNLKLEIERLNNDIKILLQENGNKEKVIKAQDNIIKEVREYVSRIIIDETYTKCILEILDKVGVDKE